MELKVTSDDKRKLAAIVEVGVLTREMIYEQRKWVSVKSDTVGSVVHVCSPSGRLSRWQGI